MLSTPKHRLSPCMPHISPSLLCLSDPTLSIESVEGAVFDFHGSAVVREVLVVTKQPRPFEVSDPALRGSMRSTVSLHALQAWLLGGGPTTLRAVWRVRGARGLVVNLRCLALGGINEVSVTRSGETVMEDECQSGACVRTLELTEGDYVLRAWTLDGQLAVHVNAEQPASTEANS